MGKKINYREPLTLVRVRIVGRYWMVGNIPYESLESIRIEHGYRCVLIIER